MGRYQGSCTPHARAKAEEYVKQGIAGVDLYISTFGPTLSVISEHWPVLTSEVDPPSGEPIPFALRLPSTWHVRK